jgi:hypothetical protein
MANGDHPKFDVFTVEDRGRNKDGFWTKIGGAWPTKDDAGLTIQLQALPLDGRLVLLPYKPPKNGNSDEHQG